MSYTKEESVEWAIAKMSEKTTEKEVDALYKWAQEKARGSNSRKNRLLEGYRENLARFGVSFGGAA
jgi:hypothetical protein